MLNTSAGIRRSNPVAENRGQGYDEFAYRSGSNWRAEFIDFSSDRLFTMSTPDSERSSAAPSPLSGWTIAYCDGGSRGNPGPAGFGVYIQDDTGNVLRELSEYLGSRTNNYAEYSGLLAALNFAIAQKRPYLRVISDSELMVKQMKGQYRVKSPDLRPLYEEAKLLVLKLERFEIRHVLREKNRHADRLANLAMDRGMRRASVPV